jgi:vanillate O-demethylase ferredoxin subunit
MTQLTVKVLRKAQEAQDIASFELGRADGGPLPPFSAGSHIDVHLPGGLVRQYSLCNPPGERHRYLIAVQREPQSRGG